MVPPSFIGGVLLEGACMASHRLDFRERVAHEFHKGFQAATLGGLALVGYGAFKACKAVGSAYYLYPRPTLTRAVGIFLEEFRTNVAVASGIAWKWAVAHPVIALAIVAALWIVLTKLNNLFLARRADKSANDFLGKMSDEELALLTARRSLHRDDS